MDEDFEKELMAYAEIDMVNETQAVVPHTIRQYHDKIKSNNECSIFDTDNELYDTNGNGFADDLSNGFYDDNVIRVSSGRGRGGRNYFYKPDKQVGGTEEDVLKHLRQAAPTGYSNEVTENSIREHHKAKREQQNNADATLVTSSQSRQNRIVGESDIPRQAPPPMSQILNNLRKQRSEIYKNEREKHTENVASQIEVANLIRQDLERSKRKLPSSHSSQASSISNKSSEDGELFWGKKPNSSSRWTSDSRRNKTEPNIKSTSDFPPLK